ncbi:hypothetical protein ACW9HQ_53765 [Nocardia gipuzkoensis]
MIKPTLGLFVALLALTACATGPDNAAQAYDSAPGTTAPAISDSDRAFLTALGAKPGLAEFVVASPYGALSTGQNLAAEFDQLVATGMSPAQAFPRMIDDFTHGDGVHSDNMTPDQAADLIRISISVYKPQYAAAVS